MKSLIVDVSPIFYRFIFGSTKYMSEKLKLEKDENGCFDLDQYEDIYVFQFLDYISNFKNRFGVDEVILAMDSKPYWRTKHWSGYKYGRMKNDKTGVDWGKQKIVQKKLTKFLEESTSFKTLLLPEIEGDDILFVLSKELSERGHEVIVKSLDHDILYCLDYPNVKYWQTKHNTPNKNCGFVNPSKKEIDELKYDHCFYGDKGDYILSVTAYTEFSDEFKVEYKDQIKSGKITPLKVWEKRHEIDVGFKNKYKDKYPELFEKHKLSAWKQPRFGKTSFEKKMLKESFNEKEFLKKNPIYEKNFELNTKIAMPEEIPDEIRETIIHNYDNSNTERDMGKLSEFFMSYGLMKLIGKMGMF